MRVIKSAVMRWSGNVARMGERRGAYRFLVGGDLRERDHLVDPGVDGTIIVTCILGKWDWWHGLD